MKRFRTILLFMCILYTSINIYAQTTKSYAVTSVIGSTGPQPVPILAITIEYYDGYLLLNGLEKYVYRTTNFDGSKQYYPVYSGNPALCTVGILISEDYSAVRQIQQSSMMGMTLQIVYNYSYIGDGYEPAQNYMGPSSY